MTDLNAPDLTEISQVCDFAETRLNQLAGEIIVDDEPEPQEWEWECLHKTRAWIEQLQQLSKGAKIMLALRTLEEFGVKLTPDTLWTPEMDKVLTISTSHVEETTTLILDAGHNLNLTIFPKDEYGWWIYVADAPTDLVSNDLKECISYAKSLGCAWLCLDRDGPIIKELAAYKW